MAEVPLTQPCKNCHSSGTIFPGKTLKSKSKTCPVCKGSCKVPYQPKH